MDFSPIVVDFDHRDFDTTPTGRNFDQTNVEFAPTKVGSDQEKVDIDSAHAIENHKGDKHLMRSIEHMVTDATVDLDDITVNLVAVKVALVAKKVVGKTLVACNVLVEFDRFLATAMVLVAKDYQLLKDKFQKHTEANQLTQMRD